jgi:D-alanyl-D-alanine carboxypeptidase
MHQQLAQNAFTQYDRVQVVEKGLYDLPGGLVIKTEKPVYVLKSKKDQVTHLVVLNRKKSLQKVARWEIQINGKTILTQKVHIERNE